MPPLELLIPFFVATSVFACIPGRGLLYAAARTISHGRRAGLLAAVGLHVGGYAHIFAAAFGLAAMLHAVPALYGAVKLAGAGYLIWLGYRMFVSREMLTRSDAGASAARPCKALTQSIVVELLNPKTALFYLSFLPQFIDASASLPIWLLVLVLGAIVNLMFSGTDILCVLLSVRAMRLLTMSQVASRVAHRVGGGILMGLGVNLAITRQ